MAPQQERKSVRPWHGPGRTFTAETGVGSQSSPYGICAGLIGTVTECSQNAPAPPLPESFHQYFNRIFSSPTLYIGQIRRRYLRHKNIKLVEIWDIRSSEMLRSEGGVAYWRFETACRPRNVGNKQINNNQTQPRSQLRKPEVSDAVIF